MTVKLPFPATFADPMRVEGKAELIGGRIIEQMATGRVPNRVGKRILLALDPFVEAGGVGEAFTDNLPLTSGRQSSNPDCSSSAGPRTVVWDGDPVGQTVTKYAAAVGAAAASFA